MCAVEQILINMPMRLIALMVVVGASVYAQEPRVISIGNSSSGKTQASLSDQPDDLPLADDGARPICWNVELTRVCVPAAAVRDAFKGFRDGDLSTLERAQLAEVQAKNDLLVARANRAECEAMLGPLETQARQSEQGRALQTLKTQYERWHPGYTLNDRGQPVKQPAAGSQ